MQDTSYIAEDSEGDEVVRAFEIALLGVTPRGLSVFQPDPDKDLSAEWDLWLNKWFAPTIAPAFVKIYSLAERFRIREVKEADHELDTALSENLKSGSLGAAESFLEGKSRMRHHPEWNRFVNWIGEGKTPGHVLTLAALQAVLFHLPLAPALLAYARFEFQSGVRKSTGWGEEEKESLFLKVLPQVQVAVRAKIDHISPDQADNESSGLQSI